MSSTSIERPEQGTVSILLEIVEVVYTLPIIAKLSPNFSLAGLGLVLTPIPPAPTYCYLLLATYYLQLTFCCYLP